MGAATFTVCGAEPCPSPLRNDFTQVASDWPEHNQGEAEVNKGPFLLLSRACERLDAATSLRKQLGYE